MAIQERNDEMVNLLKADFISRALPLYLHDGVAGMATIALDDLAGTAQTLIPDNATVDVKQLLNFQAVIKPSTGSAFTIVGNLAPGGSVNLYPSGVNALTLAINVNGSVTLQRTGGTLTYDVQLRLDWV